MSMWLVQTNFGIQYKGEDKKEARRIYKEFKKFVDNENSVVGEFAIISKVKEEIFVEVVEEQPMINRIIY